MIKGGCMELIQPMLCQEIKPSELKKYKGWLCQEKYDGIRAVIHYRNGNVLIQGRHNNNITHRYPELQDAFKGDVDFILDGEIVATTGSFNDTLVRDQNNRPMRIKTLSKLIPVEYIAFDILEFKGQNLTKIPIEHRLSHLKEILPYIKNNLKIAPYNNRPELMFSIVASNDKEGIIIKRPFSNYEIGKRSGNWLKCKNFKEKIIRFTTYETNPAGITVENEAGIRVQVAGRNSEFVKSLIDGMGYANLEIQYLSENGEGRLRHPTFKGIKNET
jgi:ATP-dependent DNA ligase